MAIVGGSDVTFDDASNIRQDEESNTCPTCGYCVFGLREPRCPECGSRFDPGIAWRASSHDASSLKMTIARFVLGSCGLFVACCLTSIAIRELMFPSRAGPAQSSWAMIDSGNIRYYMLVTTLPSCIFVCLEAVLAFVLCWSFRKSLDTGVRRLAAMSLILSIGALQALLFLGCSRYIAYFD